MKLNIGCGSQRLEGFTPHDWSLEHDARVLPYEDNSIEEIRASHVLEHLPKSDVEDTLQHWYAKLQPGGILRIAVPDFDEIIRLAQEDRDSDDESKPPFPWEAYLMGAQTDHYDRHYTLWNYPKLHAAMTALGLVDITHWKNDYSQSTIKKPDCSDHKFSLNLAGRKPTEGIVDAAPPHYQDMRACMTMPRLAWTDNMFVCQQACTTLRVPLVNSIGVFYGQCMQRMLEAACQAPDLKWVLTIDYDSIFDWKDIVCMRNIAERDGLDAIIPMQAGRERNVALLNTTKADGTSTPVTREHMAADWFPVSAGHFGLTLLRVETLRNLPKPWFVSKPAEDGTWGEGRIDDDIWFWRQTRDAGWKVGVSPKVHIGHIETMVSWIEPNGGKQFQPMFHWLRNGKPWYIRNREKVWRMPTSQRTESPKESA